jgi:hypothetical protein
LRLASSGRLAALSLLPGLEKNAIASREAFFETIPA